MMGYHGLHLQITTQFNADRAVVGESHYVLMSDPV